MEVHGVYLIDFGVNVGKEFNGKHYGIVISSKANVKYRGRFTIDKLKASLKDVIVSLKE
ncbi:MAG: hypothetical protein ACRC0G_12270 [Fusobacteriaceae bacterium]